MTPQPNKIKTFELRNKYKETSEDPMEYLEKRYQLFGLLGEGSFGKVLKARCLKTGQTVAIKHLIIEGKETFHSLKQVLAELQILRHLSACNNNVTSRLLDLLVISKSKISVK